MNEQSRPERRAVFFDIGETLIDETRMWRAWAAWLDVPEFTFFGVLGGVIERGEHHRRVFEIVAPGIDLEREQRALAACGTLAYRFDNTDLYPDVLSCLQALREEGFLLGLAGNQPGYAEELLMAMGLPVDIVASSARWGVEKPAPEFFSRIALEAGMPAAAIAYVGDRLDNDVLPARAAGMTSIFLRRGPWGHLHALRPEVVQAHYCINTLAELPNVLHEWRAGANAS